MGARSSPDSAPIRRATSLVAAIAFKKTTIIIHFVLDKTFFSLIIYSLYEPGLLSPVLVLVR